MRGDRSDRSTHTIGGMCEGLHVTRTREQYAEASCSPLDDGIASWPLTLTNTANAAGTCDAGYTQTNGLPPTRNCNADLTWGPVSNACTGPA